MIKHSSGNRGAQARQVGTLSDFTAPPSSSPTILTPITPWVSLLLQWQSSRFINTFEQALDANPKTEQFWLNYIDALIKVGRSSTAEKVIIEAEQNGVSAERLYFFGQKLQNRCDSCRPSQAQMNHAIELYQADRLAEAHALAISLTQQFPEHPFGWKVMGVLLKQMGRLDESLLPLKKSVLLSQQDAEAHTNLGVTLRALGRLDEAEASYKKAIALKPDYAEVYNNLGNMLTELGRPAEAEASLRQAISLKPDLAEAHYNLGNTLQELGRLDKAEVAYKLAIAHKPDYAKAHNNLGNTLQKLGRLDEAEASLRQAIAHKPNYAEAHRHLANNKTFSSKDDQFTQMQELYHDPNISESDRCHICFALARASDNLEDCAAAYQFYADGNALRKRQLGYDKTQDKKLIERLKASYPRISAYTLDSETISSEHSPVFIVGMLRSGTTLIEQIISSHQQVTGAGELPFVAHYGRSLVVGQTSADPIALTTFREQYLGALGQRSGAILLL